MVNLLELRLGKLEGRFEEYVGVFYKLLDGLRADHERTKLQLEAQKVLWGPLEKGVEPTAGAPAGFREEAMQRFRQTEIAISTLAETQDHLLRLIDKTRDDYIKSASNSLEARADAIDRRLDSIDLALGTMDKKLERPR